MKISLKPGETVLPFTAFEPVIQQQVFGQQKRSTDPDIRSLLEWNPQSDGRATGKPSDKPRWLTESRDNYRGFFFTDNYQRFLRLKYDDTTAEFHPDSIRAESREGGAGIEATRSAALREDGKDEESIFQIPTDLNKHPQPARSSRPMSVQPSKREANRQTPTLKKPKLNPSMPTTGGGDRKSPSVADSTAKLQPSDRPQPASVSPKRQSESVQRRRQDERIKKLKETTRWLPDSSFTTYFGKPAFCNYGRGNTNPTYGGLMYGSYMNSHNMGPHEGDNNPKYQQVYETAELKAAKRKPKAPEPPRMCKEEDRLNPDQVEELKGRNSVLPASRKFPSKDIVKPNLYDAKRFKSEHNTPDTSKLQESKVADSNKASKQPTDRGKETEKNKGAEATNLSKTMPRGQVAQVISPIGQTSKGKGIQPLASSVLAPPPAVDEENETVQDIVNEVLDVPKSITEPTSIPKSKAMPTDPQYKNTPKIGGSILHNPADEAHEPRPLQICPDHAAMSPSRRFTSTAYQEMTSKPYTTQPLVYEPFRYCKKCQSCLLPERPELTVEDMLRPPKNLGELPVQELNPRIYR